MTRRVLRHVVRLAAVILAVAAAGVVLPSPAGATTCGTASGVSVVVDFHELGGGAQSSCDAGGAGEYADQQFADAGYTLTPVNNEPGFVCQVDRLPQTRCDRTPPANAYWSLWWSDGTSGKWKYSSVGVTSLKVPAGGYVALSWQKGNAQAPPRVAATSHSSASPTTSSSSPTSPPPPSHPTRDPRPSATSSAPAAPTSGPTTPASAATSQGSSKAGKHDRAKPSQRSSAGDPASGATDATGATEAAGPVSGVDPAGPSGGSGAGGLPGWVAPAAIVVLFAGAGAVVLARRKGHGA